MPLLIWLSACSYWQRVNAEMRRATLQFLDHVERPQSPRKQGAGVLGEMSKPVHPDTKMCVRVRANARNQLNLGA
jgi:hypothetical protein